MPVPQQTSHSRSSVESTVSMSTFQTHEELRPYAMGRSADVRQPIGKPVTLRPGRSLVLRFEEGMPVHTHHSCTIQQSLLADVLMPVNEKPG